MKQLMFLLLLIFPLCANTSSAQSQSSVRPEMPKNCDVTPRYSLLVERAELPRYPALAIAARVSGVVCLHVVVRDGAVTEAKAESQDLSVLAYSAVENVKTWRFSSNLDSEFKVKYVFELEKQETILPENSHVEMQLPGFVRIIAKPVKPTHNN